MAHDILRVFPERSGPEWQVVYRHTHQNIYWMASACLNAMLATRALFIFDLILMYSENMLKRVLSLSLIGSIGILAILVQTTTPSTIGPVGVLIVFILLYVGVLSALTFVLYKASQLIAKASRLVVAKKPVSALSFTRSYYFSSVLSLAPVMIIGMQSVGEVGAYDVLLVGAFVAVACLYVAKRTA